MLVVASRVRAMPGFLRHERHARRRAVGDLGFVSPGLPRHHANNSAAHPHGPQLTIDNGPLTPLSQCPDTTGATGARTPVGREQHGHRHSRSVRRGLGRKFRASKDFMTDRGFVSQNSSRQNPTDKRTTTRSRPSPGSTGANRRTRRRSERRGCMTSFRMNFVCAVAVLRETPWIFLMFTVRRTCTAFVLPLQRSRPGRQLSSNASQKEAPCATRTIVASFAPFRSRLRRPDSVASTSKLVAPSRVRAMPGFLRHERHLRHARPGPGDDLGFVSPRLPRRHAHQPLRIHMPTTDH
jgi:hypothetical protein